MFPLRSLLYRLGSVFQRSRIERNLREEIQSHLDLATEAHMQVGLSEQEARLAAQREFGGVEQIKERYRDERGLPWLEQLQQDGRIAWRTARRNPRHSALVILTVALGIAVNTTTFSFLRAMLYRPLPFAEPDRLVRVARVSPRYGPGPHAPGDVVELIQANRVFSHCAIIDAPSYSLAEPGRPAEQVKGCAVNGDFFATFGTTPLIGRLFGADEDQPGHAQVVVLSYEFWMRRFGGDPGILGRTLHLDGEAVTVIGVMREGDSLPIDGRSVDLLKPLGWDAVHAGIRDGYWLQLVARLKPGVSLEQARANLDTIAARQLRDNPKATVNGYRVVPFTDPDTPQGALLLWMAMGLAFSVLLVACANLANLQLARGTGRSREFAIRLAVGATRPRLIRQLLTESVLLSLIGGALGVLSAKLVNLVLSARFTEFFNDPGFRLAVDSRVLGGALIATVVTGVLFGGVPAWLTSKLDVNSGLKQAGPGVSGSVLRRRIRNLLIVAEIAVTLTLLAGVGYFVVGINRLSPHPTGWETGHLLKARLALPAARYPTTEKVGVFCERLQAEMAAIPGVDHALICDILPTYGFFNSRQFAVEQGPAAETGANASSKVIAPSGLSVTVAGSEPVASTNTVTPGYFGALGMKVLRGRRFTAQDRTGAPAVVIVNQALAEHFWPGEDPIGKRVGSIFPDKRDWLEVVGVVNDVGLGARPINPYQLYLPVYQTGGWYFSIAVRSSTLTPESLIEPLRRAVYRVDPDLAIYQAQTVAQQIKENARAPSLLGAGLTVIALSGLLLSALGLYGVIANLVAERTSEIGIRMALGADNSGITWLLLRQGLTLIVAGLTVGIGGAWAVARLLTSTVGELVPQSPALIGLCCGVLTTAALLACWAPVRRALRIDPLQVLRAE